MKEEFLHYIWKYKLYEDENLETVSGEKVEILNQGTHNSDAGPDFFNAKIKINDTVWAGNIEIHTYSADWFAHNHQNDKAYDNVVLQVVHKYNKEVKRTNSEIIPTLELKFDIQLLEKYNLLIQSENWISCQDDIDKVDSFTLQNWIEKLAIERLESKSEQIHQLLKQTNNSWEEAFYIQLARNFGFKLNSDPFEMLAKSLPLNYLGKHKSSLTQIEAFLFGQAGFLYEESGDNYYENLKKEYRFLASKFKLKPIEKHLWKFLRSRPGNFPTIRIAQFAKLIHQSSSLFSKILETETVKDFYKLIVVESSEYWKSHYVFNKESVEKTKALGKSAVDIFLINTIIPFLFVYGKAKGLSELQDKSIYLLENIKAEKNSIISKWSDLKIKAMSAFETQALIQLKNQYCNHKKCLNCHVGNYLIKNKNESARCK